MWCITVVLGLSSCVSTKKYEDLAFQKRQLESDKMELISTAAAQERTIMDLRKKEEALTVAESQLERTKSDLAGLTNTHQDLKQQYDELLARSSQVLSSATEERALLASQLSDKEGELDRKERELRLMEMKLQAQERNLESLREDVVIRERKLQELTYKLNQQDSIMHLLRSTIHDALKGISDADLTISEFQGKVYVSLSQNLLFAKGSNVIDPAGRDALRKLANVLKRHPDIQINVEGHTDSDGSAEKNWDLSVSRATAVVKTLTAGGANPDNIIASGRGMYFPIAPNDNEANKSKNRRTEIILSPKLDLLYSLLE